MRSLETASFDGVITDPPYIIGAISVGNSSAKTGTWVDMENAAWWFAEWFRQSARVLKPTGYLCVFGNWRSLPTIICALAKVDLSATSCMVWDKQWIGPAGPQQLRPTWELVVWVAMDKAIIKDRSLSDVWRCKWMAGNNGVHHPAEKPVALMRSIITAATPPNGLVLDPFMGSGSTGVAALSAGRQFVGIEKDEKHFATAQQRLKEVQPDMLEHLMVDVPESSPGTNAMP